MLYNKTCQHCHSEFEVERNSRKRKYCFTCVSYGDKHHVTTPEGQRVCYQCHNPKSIEQFVKSTSEPSGYSWLCKKCASDNTTAHQKTHKQKCLAYKGGKCQVCGYDKCARALQFHHVDPNGKDFCIATYRCRAWETVKAELDKCLLVCSNCHAEIHDGTYILP